MKAAAKKTTQASEKKRADEPVNRVQSGNPKDVRQPDIDASRHAANGMQETPTSALGAEAPGQAAASGASAIVDPLPKIGVTHDEGEANHKLDAEAVEGQDSINSYEQALSLPVVEDGKGVTAWKPSAKAKPAKGANPEALPVTSFKDKDRRTMLVGKQGGKFVAFPADKAEARA